MWSPKIELLKKARDIATKTHANGYNKKQLIAASKKVYDGFGVTQTNPLTTKKIRTMETVVAALTAPCIWQVIVKRLMICAMV